MDVNNRGNNQAAAIHQEGEMKPAFVTRRKRKTMSHVPAPLNPAEESGFAVSTDPQLNEERCDVEARSDREQINLSHGDEGEDRKKFDIDINKKNEIKSYSTKISKCIKRRK